MPIPQVGKEIEANNGYVELVTARRFWRASHIGGYRYVDTRDARGRPVLWKYRREKDDDYSERLSQAVLSNYLRPVASAYVDFVLRPGVDRGNPSEYSAYNEWLVDVDLVGSTMDEFMSVRAREAFVEATSFGLVDSTATGAEVTGQDALGVKYFVRGVHPDNVPWYLVDRGQIVEAVVLLEDANGRPFGIYYTKETMTRFEYDPSTTLNGNIVPTAVSPTVAHTYGGCPLVILDFRDLHLAADIAEKQKQIFNRESMLQEELVNSTYTTWLFRCDKPAEGEDSIEMGSSRVLFGGSESNGVDRIGADPAQANSIRTSIENDVTEIYRIAGLTPGNPVKVGDAESGLAKAFSFNELKSRLDSYAKKMELFEATMTQRAASAAGFPWPGMVKYSREFDPRDRQYELELAIMAVESPLPDEFKRAQLREAVKAFAMSPQERIDALEAPIPTQGQTQQDQNKNQNKTEPRSNETENQ